MPFLSQSRDDNLKPLTSEGSGGGWGQGPGLSSLGEVRHVGTGRSRMTVWHLSQALSCLRVRQVVHSLGLEEVKSLLVQYSGLASLPSCSLSLWGLSATVVHKANTEYFTASFGCE